MIIKLLTEHHLEFLRRKKEAAEARPSLHLSKCQIVGNIMSRLIFLSFLKARVKYQHSQNKVSIIRKRHNHRPTHVTTRRRK